MVDASTPEPEEHRASEAAETDPGATGTGGRYSADQPSGQVRRAPKRRSPGRPTTSATAAGGASDTAAAQPDAAGAVSATAAAEPDASAQSGTRAPRNVKPSDGARRKNEEQVAAEPRAKRAAQPRVNRAAGPQAQQTAEPETKQAAVPQAQQTADPQAQQAAVPRAQQTAKPEAKKSTKPRSQQTAKPRAKQAAEPPAKAGADAVSEQTAKPRAKQAAEPQARSTGEATGKRRSTRPAVKRAGGARAGARTRTRASAKSTLPRVLPPTPRLPRSGKTVLDGLGVPVFGARHGAVERVDWSALSAEHRRHPVVTFLRHRRWVFATATTDRHLISLAIVDGGVTATAFCMVTDLVSGETLVDSSRPGAGPLARVGDYPLDGLQASYRLPGTDYRISTEPGSREVRIRVRLRKTAESLPGLRWVPGIRNVPVARDLPTASARPWVDVDLTLEPTVAPPLTAISRVDAHGGLVTSTMKTAAMNTWGTVTVHGEDPETPPQQVSLDGGTGGLDYTNGFLPRRTRWRWAYTTGRLADGRLFGLNLVSEFSGIGDEAVENAVWLDGALIPMDPKVRVLFNRRDLHAPWTVRTLDGSIHLSFEPLAVHDEALNLGLLHSKFVQPTGHYTGHVTVDGEQIHIDRMPGLIEDQDIRW